VNEVSICNVNDPVPTGQGDIMDTNDVKVETPIHDSIRELLTWECKKHGVKS
jgi:hypothetical protein